MEITKLVSFSLENYLQYEPGQQNLYNSASLGTKLNLLKTHGATYKIVFCCHTFKGRIRTLLLDSFLLVERII